MNIDEDKELQTLEEDLDEDGIQIGEDEKELALKFKQRSKDAQEKEKDVKEMEKEVMDRSKVDDVDKKEDKGQTSGGATHLGW